VIVVEAITLKKQLPSKMEKGKNSALIAGQMHKNRRCICTPFLLYILFLFGIIYT
jgi:hypothetical protein